MSCPQQDLWRNISGRTAIRISTVLRRLQSLGEAEVHQFGVAAIVHRDDHVFRLQVTVDDVLAVQELERHHRDCTIEHHIRHDCLVVSANLRQKRAALDVFELKVQILFVLERRVCLHDERTMQRRLIVRVTTGFLYPARCDRRPLIDDISVHVIQIKQNLALIDDMIDVLHLGDCLLLEGLQSDKLLPRLIPSLVDLAEVSDADNLVEVEIGNLRLRFALDVLFKRDRSSRRVDRVLSKLLGRRLRDTLNHAMSPLEAFVDLAELQLLVQRSPLLRW